MYRLLEDIENLKAQAINVASDLQPWKDYYRLRAKELEILFSVYRLKKVDRVLEIGCGNGFISAILSRFANEVIATDLSKLNIKTHSIGIFKAKALIQRLNIENCKIVSCSAEELPFEDKFFDLVFCAYSLEHVPDKNKALKELKRVLKNNGETIFLVPNFIERLFYPLSFYPEVFKKIISTLFRKNNTRSESGLDFVSRNSNQSSSLASSWSKFRKNYPHFPVPEPHGAYPNFFSELFESIPSFWLKLFKEAGLEASFFFSIMLIPRILLALYDPLRFYERFSWIEKRFGQKKIFRVLGQYLCIVVK